MIRIFLVEDEVYALKALEQKIKDLQGPFVVAATAANGTEALAKIDQACPSILMTDIRMPDMDGITLIDELQKRGNSHILPVIISGYQEFEYARQAVRLGVQDYLLKPVDPKELSDCLDACVARLQQRDRKDNAASFLIGEDSLSFDWMPETYDYVVAYLIVGNALTNYENIVHPSIPYIPSGEVEDLVHTIFQPSVVCHCYDGLFSNEKVLVLGADIIGRDVLAVQFHQLAGTMAQNVGSYITLQFSRTDSGETVAHCVRACRRDALQRLVWGKTQVSCEAAASYQRDRNLKEHAELFQMLISQGDADLLRSNIARVFTEWDMAEHTAMSMQEDMILLLGLLSNRFSEGKTPISSSFYVENLVCFSDSPQEIQENFAQLLLELFGKKGKADTRGVQSEELVERTVRYFQDHLYTNLTLQMITEEIGISKVYLCRIFNKHKNTTPIDYFTHMKIDKAKGLIKQFPGMPLREISDLLGFADTYYFSKVYKRITGHSPSEERTQ